MRVDYAYNTKLPRKQNKYYAGEINKSEESSTSEEVGETMGELEWWDFSGVSKNISQYALIL